MPFDSLPLLPLESGPDYRPLAPRTQARSLGRILGGLVNAWLVHRDRKRARHQLLALDDRALRDIGLSRCDAVQGVARQLWRP